MIRGHEVLDENPPDAEGTGVPTLISECSLADRVKGKAGGIMMSPEFQHMLEPIGGEAAIVLAARHTVQLVTICRVKRDDIPEVARAIWGKSRRRRPKR